MSALTIRPLHLPQYDFGFFALLRDLMSQKKMGEHWQMNMRGHYLEKRREGRKMKI